MKKLSFAFIPLILILLTSGICSAQGYQVGDRASDFALPSVDGKKVSLADYPEAKGFIVVFTCNTCPYARAYESRIMDLDQKFASRGFPVIAINPNNPELQPGDSFQAMEKRAASRGYSFPYLLDEGQEVYPRFGATRTPHVFILQRLEGAYLVRYIGTIDDNYQDAGAVKTPYVEQAVEALLKGDAVPLETTRAIGCSIKA
jgi:peroxiredoxin